MAQKCMTIKEFSKVLRWAKAAPGVRYIKPTMHARTHDVVALEIYTSDGVKEFTVTNNPDDNFDLYDAVSRYFDELEAKYK